MSSASSEILLFILIILSMVFSSSETAFTKVSAVRIRNMVEENVKGAKRVEKLLSDPKRLLTTILIGNNVVNIGASALATSIALERTVDGPLAPYIVTIVTVVLTFVILIFGEITPKNLAVQHADRVALIVAPFLEICMILFSPIALALNILSGGIIKLFGMDEKYILPSITEAELKTLVSVSQEEGVLEDDEKEMIHNVFDFGDYFAEQVMTPRTDVVAIEKNADYEDIIELFNSSKFSRIPVYEDTLDSIIGILYIKDFIFSDKESFSIDKYLRDVYFTYESKPIKQLFQQMRINRYTLSVVLDEYGGTQGIVTLEDLVEEIVGEILDENDEADEEISEINETEFIVPGGTRLEDIHDSIGINFISEDFDTLGGYVIGLAGKIPDEGEVLEDDSCKFEVLEVEKNRIEKIRVNICVSDENDIDIDDES